MHGAGELILPNGGRYVGQFSYNDFRRGKGERPDRSVAYGNFYGLNPDGIKVKVNYINGAEYEGGMKEGEQSGFGMYKTKTGIKTVGKFEKGLVTGGAQTSFPDGTEYYSTYSMGKETEPGITVTKKANRNQHKRK